MELADWEADPTMAVVAHGLLNAMAVITGTAMTVRRNWDRLEHDQRDRMLGSIERQAEFVTGLLQDLVRGLPPDVEAALQQRSY
jgi:K+-sensing histidine kinase KdpD